MDALVSGGLPQALDQHRSTMLMWVTTEYGATMTTGQQYAYFTDYFGSGYGGYYNNTNPSAYLPWNWWDDIGVINLKTGVLMDFPIASDEDTHLIDPEYILELAEEANQ